MRLSSIVLVAVLSSIKTASGEVNIDQPQLPVARSIDTALWSKTGGVDQRSLRSFDDTYSKSDLDIAEADDEERGIEYLKKFNPAKLLKAKMAKHKLRKAQKLAANQQKFKEDMAMMQQLEDSFFSKWRKKGWNEAQGKADLKKKGFADDVADSILVWYTK